MGQNFRLFHVSNLSIQIFRILSPHVSGTLNVIPVVVKRPGSDFLPNGIIVFAALWRGHEGRGWAVGRYVVGFGRRGGGGSPGEGTVPVIRWYRPDLISRSSHLLSWHSHSVK